MFERTRLLLDCTVERENIGRERMLPLYRDLMSTTSSRRFRLYCSFMKRFSTTIPEREECYLHTPIEIHHFAVSIWTHHPLCRDAE
jgi:hypothetical protein